MNVEFRVPILPEAGFLSNVKLAALSLTRLGGKYATAPLHVSVGDTTTAEALKETNPWASAFPVNWLPVSSDFSRREFASGMHRYSFAAASDVVVLMDADACLMRPIDELIENLGTARRPTIAGLCAHVSPFSALDTSEADWRTLLAAAGFTDAPLQYNYSMLPPAAAGHCPPYFNYGFVAFNTAAFELIRPLIPRYTEMLLGLLAGKREIFFTAQIALTCAILETGVDVIALGPEYNCPNSDEMAPFGLGNVDDIRVMHFLRKDVMDRHEFLCDRDAFVRFRSTAFASPVLQAFREHVLGLPDVFYDAAR